MQAPGNYKIARRPRFQTLVFALVAGLLVGPGCLTHFKNYSGQRQGLEIALVRQQGIRFRLAAPDGGDSEETPVDELYLEPGRYLIWFVQTATRTGGAGTCQVSAGKSYGFEITGRSFLPETKHYAFTGRCVENPAPADGWDRRLY